MDFPNVLYILSSFNTNGGTPKKTLDLAKYYPGKASVYAYQRTDDQFVNRFKNVGADTYEGYFGRNIAMHIKYLLKIIDDKEIRIIQTQFTFGEILGGLLKLLRPKIKLVISFVGPFEPSGLKKVISKVIYKNVNEFIYVSEYVKREKEEQFKFLKEKGGVIIYNGTELREKIDPQNEYNISPCFAILSVAGLTRWKNVHVLIKAMDLIVNRYGHNDIKLYVAGDGPERENLIEMISHFKLNSNVFLMGYRSDIGNLLERCDLFVHSSKAEGFGIVVPEAMLAQKPIIIADAGALPEIIEDGYSGIVVPPDDSEIWAKTIIKIHKNTELAQSLSSNALSEARKRFTAEIFCKNYSNLYKNIIKDA